MVTGIETAGLALAVFPLVVSGLQAYAEGARTIRELWRPEMALKSLIRELGMEKCKFENTCTSLLEGMVTDSDLTLLMESPGGSLWSELNLQEKLECRFSPGTVKCYMDAMKDLASTLQILQENLGLDGDDTPKPDDRRTYRKRIKKMVVVFSKPEHKELLQNINKINSDLATLTGQSKSANSPRQLTAPAKHYTRIRNHAITLFGVLKERLQAASTCACTQPHDAALRLEVRNATAVQKGRSQDTGLRFHVILSSESNPSAVNSPPCNWREMGLEPMGNEKEQAKVKNSGDSDDESSYGDMTHSLTEIPDKTDSSEKRGAIIRGNSEPNITSRIKIKLDHMFPDSFTDLYPGRSKNRQTKPPRSVAFTLPHTSCADSPPITPDHIPRNTMRIENLCLSIQRAKGELSCLGVLVGGGGGRYRVWPLRIPPPTSEPTRMLSLESLLTRPGALKKKDRLILGVQLASTVMQLHTTEWLGESWGKGDILFYEEMIQGKSGGVANISPVLRKPLVRRSFAPLPPQSIQEPTNPIFVPHNQSLFSLGIILIELWHGKCLEDLRIEADRSGISGVADMTDYITARRLIDGISEDAGEKYGDAVRRCISGLDYRSSSLEKEDFKDQVHMKVVSPLVENLESFCATKLMELL